MDQVTSCDPTKWMRLSDRNELGIIKLNPGMTLPFTILCRAMSLMVVDGTKVGRNGKVRRSVFNLLLIWDPLGGEFMAI